MDDAADLESRPAVGPDGAAVAADREDRVTHGAVQRDGVRLAYREHHPAGTADPAVPPVVLIHGLFAAAWSWDRLAPQLADRGRRVLVVELRGHGRSAAVPPYDLATFVADTAFLLDAVAPGPVDLVGHSLGGHVGTVLAMTEPGRVRRLVVEDAPPPPVPGDRSYRGPRLSSLPPRDRALLLGFLAVRYRWVRRHLNLDLARSVLAEFRRPDLAWWDGLARITAPTLVIGGGPRSHVPGHRLAEMARRLPDGRLETWAVGHRVHHARPAEFARLVGDFLDGRTPAPPGPAGTLNGGPATPAVRRLPSC